MECDHVGVPLAENYLAGFCSGGSSEVGAINLTPLVEDHVLRAVEVLRLLICANSASTETENASAAITKREGDPTSETIVDIAFLVLCREAGVH